MVSLQENGQPCRYISIVNALWKILAQIYPARARLLKRLHGLYSQISLKRIISFEEARQK
jgi:hypothetical protein